MGAIKDRAKRDIERITSNLTEWADVLTFTAPDGTIATINGLHTKHHLGVDAQLQKFVNAQNAHCSFSEKFLTDLNYPLRNAKGKVDLAKHKVTAVDSTGTSWTYVITENFPDETIGLIVCLLNNWSES